jgi:hypothetical protein
MLCIQIVRKLFRLERFIGCGGASPAADALTVWPQAGGPQQSTELSPYLTYKSFPRGSQNLRSRAFEGALATILSSLGEFSYAARN